MRALLLLLLVGLGGFAQTVRPWQKDTPEAAILDYLQEAVAASDVRVVTVEKIDSIGFGEQSGQICLIVITTERFDGGVIPFHLELPYSSAGMFRDTVYIKPDSSFQP